MSFLLPQFLWALLALVPLALVYLIKVHPLRRRTSAWFLWEGIFQERRAASLLQKLRDWLSLLLMALAFIFLVLSLAQPVLNDGASAERLVLIVDNSLSMNADGRLSEARRAAQGMIRSLPAGGRAAVFSLGEELVSATGFTESRRELMRGLDTVIGCDAPLNASALSHFFRDDAMDEKQRVLLFSDGCFDGVDRLPEGIELVKVGRPEENLGITAFDVRRIPGENRPLGVFFRIFSSAWEDVEADVLLAYGSEENIRRVFPLTLNPGINEAEIIQLPNGEAGRWILTLDHRDALDRDNRAFAVVPESNPVKVAVRAPETHMFWQLCVEAFGEGVNSLVMAESGADLELYRGTVADAPASRLAVFAPAGESVFWKSVSGDPVEASARVVLTGHPLVRYANLDGLVLQGVRRVVPPDQAVVVAETDDGIPLIYKTSQGDSTAYVFNFDPAQNYFFLSPLFPVLVWSTASELMDLEDMPSSSVPAGAMAQLPAGLSEGAVTQPDGEIVRYTDGRFGPLTQFGFYEVQSGDQQMTIACSVAPVSESNLVSESVADAGKIRSAGFPLSDWFMAAALLLLALECSLYHRRKVG